MIVITVIMRYWLILSFILFELVLLCHLERKKKNDYCIVGKFWGVQFSWIGYLFFSSRMCATGDRAHYMPAQTCFFHGSYFRNSAINNENHENWTPWKFPTVTVLPGHTLASWSSLSYPPILPTHLSTHAYSSFSSCSSGSSSIWTPSLGQRRNSSQSHHILSKSCDFLLFMFVAKA